MMASGKPSTTHVDEDGLWIPPELREFNHGIVIRTPRATIQHFGQGTMEPYYSLVSPEDFVPLGEIDDARNPDLAPDRVIIKPYGKDSVELTVEVRA